MAVRAMPPVKRWRGPGLVIVVNEAAKTIRIRDSHLMLNAAGVGFAFSALWPFVVVRLRPAYVVTVTGYGMSVLLASITALCVWMNLRHSTNDVTIHLATQMLECRSGLLRRRCVIPLREVSFRTTSTTIEVFGQTVEGVAVQVDGPGVAAKLVNFTPECSDVVRGFNSILSGASDRPAEETLRRIESQASELPPHKLVELFTLFAVVFGMALWMMLRYLIEPVG